MREREDARRRRPRARERLNVKAELAWLEGAPAGSAAGPGLAWQVVPALGTGRGALLGLGRADLRRATLAVKTLARERPRLLDRLGGDGRRWGDVALAQLEALKPAVHDGEPLADPCALADRWVGPRSGRLARDVARRCSAAVEPIVWRFAREPEALDRALRWAMSESAALAQLSAHAETVVPAVMILRLAQLAEAHGADRVAPLCRALAERAAFDCALYGDSEASRVVDQWARGSAAEPRNRPVPLLAPELALFIERLVEEGTRRRRHALDLAELILPTEDVPRWERWWNKRDALLGRARDACAHLPPGKKRKRELTRLLELIRQHERRTPPAWSLSYAFSLILEASGEGDRVIQAIIAALAAFPREFERRLVRPVMLYLWSSPPHHPREARALVADVEAAAAFAAAHDRATAAGHWQRFWRSGTFHECIDEYLMRDDRPAEISAYYAALARYCAERGDEAKNEIGSAAFQHLIRYLSRQAPADRAARLCIALRRHESFAKDRFVPATVVRLALDLGGDDDGAVVELAAALIDVVSDDEMFDVGDPVGLAAACGDRRVAALLGAIARRDVRRVLRLGRRLFVLRRLGGVDVPCSWPNASGRGASWMRRYPAACSERLRALASIDERAEQSAAALLGHDFADPAATRTEMDAIAARLRTALDATSRARLEKRLANLGRRLGTPPAPTGRKLAALSAKLDALVERRTLEVWETRVEHNLSALVVARLSLPRAPEWLLEPPAIDLLPHLLRLPRPHRQLAQRVLCARAGPYPWDLRDEPQNRAFLERLDARGIDTRPWLEGIGVLARDATLGRAFLQLERDPLEALRMGEHFETCLTPGWVNFFSAVSNTADINKRVLYARDIHGGVIGRCLLALTAEGRLLTFHAYFHDDAWCFAEMARAFVLALAKRMGTEVVREGRVELLLASEWYDDGPEDLTGRFEELYSDELGQKLASLPPADAVAAIERAVEPVGLGPVTLPMVLGLHAVVLRDDVVAALAPRVAAEPELSLPSRAAVAVAAHRAGAHAVARELAITQIAPRLERYASRARPVPLDFVVLLVDLGEATLALRVLMRTRPRGVRRWSDETDADRLAAAARAHAALHRHKAALALCDKLEKSEPLRATAIRQALMGDALG